MLTIDEMRALLDSTTEGPWVVAYEVDGVMAGKKSVVRSGQKRVFSVDQTRPHHRDKAEANAAFAAKARDIVPELLDRIGSALAFVWQYGGIDGDHHKAWVIDQVVRKLTVGEYDEWVAEYEGDPNDEGNYYSWDTGIAP